METISNSSKNIFQELAHEFRLNPLVGFFLLVLLTIPLKYSYNSIAIGLFAIANVVYFKKENFNFQKTLFLPIVFFILMSLSFFWSIDLNATKIAILKVTPFLIIPLCFLTMNPFSNHQKNLIVKTYGYGFLIYITFYIVRASINFYLTNDTSSFFYHKLVTEDVNAIHVSVYVTLAMFYFFTKDKLSIFDKFAVCYIGIFIFLLSSKNIIIILFLLMFLKQFYFFKAQGSIKWITIALVSVLIFIGIFSEKISKRFLIEFQSNQAEGALINDFPGGDVYNVSINQAWNKNKFMANEYFPGVAFRIYQIRVFKELEFQDDIFFKGYGLNATDQKIEQRGVANGVFLGNAKMEGYQKKNFHNQYIQTFAEIGFFGFLTLMAIALLNIKNAIKTKNFIHICFAILMLSLFLSESFLSRQRGIVFFVSLYCFFNTKYLISSFQSNPN